MSWYLRSLADADTHRGHYSIVTRSVHALCGIEFVPRQLPLGGPALSGSPWTPRRSARSAAPPGTRPGEQPSPVKDRGTPGEHQHHDDRSR